MFRTVKKSTFLLAFVVILLVVGLFFFAPQSPNQLKSSLYDLGTNEPLWGQAYSPDIGWINFYCNGGGKTQPTGVSHLKGAESMPNFCDDVAYGVTYNDDTRTFSGEAYSSNYGWLDMSGLTVDNSYKFHGSTDGSAFSEYNFGTTYFQKNDPNSLSPGVDYYDDLGYFCGFAYSRAAGFISFCDPGTKEISPTTIDGFDFNTYAVYLGMDAGAVYTGFSCVINNENYYSENRLPGLTASDSTIADGSSKSLAENSYLALGSNGWLDGADDIICTTDDDRYAIFNAASLQSSTVTRNGAEYTYTLTDENSLTASAKFSFPIAAATCTQNPSSGSPTTSAVSVTANCPTSKLTSGCTSSSQNYTFNTNGSHVFYWIDTIGRRATCSAEVSWIDKKSYSLTSSNCTSPNPSAYSTSWLSSASASAYNSLGNFCDGSCDDCTVSGASSSCSIPEGIGQSCTVSISNTCTYFNETTWCSSSGWDPYCPPEDCNESCTTSCGPVCESVCPFEKAPWFCWNSCHQECSTSCTTTCTTPACYDVWSCYASTTDCSYKASATCSDSYSCTSAQANVDKTAPTTSSGIGNIVWTTASDFYNWSEWTDESITAQVGCDDNLSGCSPLASSGSASSNQTLSISVSDSAGNSTSTSVTVSDWIDKTNPAMTSAGEVFAANNQKYITVGFADGSSELRSVSFTINGVDNGSSLTCVDDEGQTNTAYHHDVGSDSSWVAGLTCDFSVAQYYDLKVTACDVAGNCTNPASDGLYANFYHVVAAVPSSSNSYFAFSSGTKVADGQDSHSAQAVLIDGYDNPVVSVSGITAVNVNFTFENTTKLDQIAGTGDSAKFTASEFSFSQEGGTSTGYLTEATGGDGKFQVDVQSFAPTSNGYTPIENDGFNLWFDEITYQVTALNGYTNVGESSGTFASTDENRKFGFKPALISTPQALIWNSTTGVYEVDSSGIENITINAPKRLSVDLLNQSSSVTIESPQIGVALGSDSTDVLWKEGVIEKVSTTEGLTEILSLDTDDDTIFDGGGVLKDLITWISEITTVDNSKNLRFRATPELQTSSMPESSTTTLQTYLCYNDGKAVCHRSEKLASGGSALLQNPSVEIIGSVQSSGGTSSKQTGTELNQSLGDIAQSELRNAIGPNILALTQNPASSVCDSADVTITTTSELTNLSCKNNASSVFYFKDHDVTLGDGVNPLTLPSGAKTILVENGNLYIKSNLVYPTGNTNSFGVIVLKNAAGAGGNIFVYPGVTNIVGAFYAEGSLVSVNAIGKCGEDTSPSCDGSTGFCDRSYELRNQLYWKGLIATQNTIGGADSTLIFPSGVAASCPPPSCSTATPSCTSSEIARIYDLAYLRTFHPASGGTQIYSSSDDALVVEYDSRIQSNPPPLFEVGTGGFSNQLSN